MASYLETLMADQARLRQSLMGVIEQEAAAVRELQERLTDATRGMDQMIVRLTIYRQVFGNGATQTLDLQTEIEDAGKPLGEVRADLEQHQRILQALQEALLRVDQGTGLEPPPEDATRKLSIAEVLGG